MENKEIYIKKFNGEIELFNVEKLKTSMRRSKATEEQINSIVKQILPSLYDGIPSKDI